MQPKSFDDLYQEAEAHEDYWVAGLVQGFTEEVFRLMESRDISRSELARRLGTSPAYVTKILRGNANFTLGTMVKLARALEADLHLQLGPAAAADQIPNRRPKDQRKARRQRSADVPDSGVKAIPATQ